MIPYVSLSENTYYAVSDLMFEFSHRALYNGVNRWDPF